MKELKFTPGPWYAVNYAGYINIQNDDYYESQNLLDENGCDEAKANGVLAAAAPDLLAACQAFMELFRNSDMRPEDESYEVADIIDAAIQKALGIKKYNIC